MIPTKRQVLKYAFNNVNVELRKKIMAYLRAEKPAVIRNFWLTLVALLAFWVALGVMLAIDENFSLDLFVALYLGSGVIGIWVFYSKLITMFMTYFEVFPEDFPENCR